MGSNEEGKSSKSEKSSSPSHPQDQTNPAQQANIQVYPDWAALQAYYGPRVTLPPYYNSAVASGHPPHPYMWGPPQAMMSLYGAPYAALYSHGSVYAHPAVTLGPHSQAHGVPTSPITAGTPLNAETPKSTGNTNGGLTKKLKRFDGLAMSIGNGNSQNVDGGVENMLSQSSGETDGSSDASDVNMAMASQPRRKRSRERTPTPGKDEKSESQDTSVIAGEITGASDKLVGTAITSCVMGKLIGPLGSPTMSTALELKNPVSTNMITATTVPQTCPVLPENWMLNEREIKRERRKQSNRESARRSRLRKQAETEELAQKVDSMVAENEAIRSEINRLTEKSGKLEQENVALLEKLKTVQTGRRKDVTTEKAENLLSRVNNSDSVERSIDEENNMYKKPSNSNVKLRQLLGASPRTDAVAAG